MLIIMTLSLSCVSLALSPMSSFSSVNYVIKKGTSSSLFSTSPLTSSTSSSLEPIFDFTTPSPTFTPTHPINKFERIDDAIMGGISTSSLKFIPDQPYSSWSGICREFGGGFCGMRTLPFVDPLYCNSFLNNGNTNGTATDTAGSTSATGMFVKCRLASDNEPFRRVWKMTLRTDSSRGETVYQSQFQLPPSSSLSIDEQKEEEGGEFHTIYIPFTSFQQVRGPRIVPDGPPLKLTNGIYQIGMTMSKFQMGMNTTQIENFRDGFFDLQLQQIGFYYDNDDKSTTLTANNSSITTDQQIIITVNNNDNNKTIQTLTKEEMMKKRPLLFKLIIALSKIFFSEQANRRKSAMHILRTKRQMTRVQAITFGLKNRAKSIGLFRSVVKTVSIVAIDVFRTILKNVLKVGLVLPLKLVRRGLQGVGLMKKKVSMKE